MMDRWFARFMGALGHSHVNNYLPGKKNLLVLEYWTGPYNKSPVAG